MVYSIRQVRTIKTFVEIYNSLKENFLNRTNVAKNIVAVFLGVTFLVEAIYELVSFVKLAKALGEQSVVENKETDSFSENEQKDVAQPKTYETAKQNEKTQDKTSQLKKTKKKVVSKNKSIKK